MIIRTEYLQTISNFIGIPEIKVITGMRRCGKSFLLKQIIQELIDKHQAKEKNIIYIDKESSDFDFITNNTELNIYISSKLNLETKTPKYILIDEVQEIESWEKTLRSLTKNNQAEIFITGSNASLLSSELATFISGRYIEIPVLPLSFKEFLEFRESKKPNLNEEFKLYLRYGSMPGIHNSKLDDITSYPLLQSILSTVILKDVIARHEIRNYSIFENILKFVFDNIGSTLSAKSISDYFKSQKIKMSIETIQSYISFLEAAFLIYKARRYDIKGKRYLEIHEKYYVTDIGLRHALLGYRDDDINDYLENIVYLELKRRGYEVSVGKLNETEIDFIASKTNEKIYIQVCYLLASPETVDREFNPLQKIKDNHPKLVLSMDEFWGASFEGIKRINIIEFLMERSNSNS